MTARAALFDLGNTLVHYYRRGEFAEVLRHCLDGAVRAAEVAPRDASADDLFERALELNREASDFAVRPLPDRLRELLPGCAGAPEEQMERVCRAFMAPIFACARADPDAAHVLDALRERGVRTAVVSNTPWGSPAAYWREELERHGLLRRVDAAVFCVDVGWRKPHPAPMLRALAQLGVEPQEALFVGDDPRWDVEGARQAGIRPVLLSAEPGVSPPDCIVVPDLQSVLDVVAADAQRESRPAV
jgi:HAD superfamily hydrolase (TIGR01509 family)